MVNAFLFFGGVPQQVLTDRMKTVVLHTQQGQAVWQADFERFAADLGFVPKLCRVRRPQTKGKVERLVCYVKESFFPGRRFLDLCDLNQQAQRWLERVNGRIHGSTHEIPLERLAEEGLKPLPEDGWHLSYLLLERRVSRDAFVSYAGRRYGVNRRLAGERLLVRQHGDDLYFIDREGEIQQHHKQLRFNRRYVMAPNQYEGLDASQGYRAAPGRAFQIDVREVQERDLETYARMAGGR